eukprot:gene6305-7469_t
MAVSLRDIVRISGEYDPTAVRQLALNDLGLVNLGAVGKCSNLMVLSINRNNIQDLQPLAKMENLEVLHASENRISSLQSLSNMILLRDLRLEGNPLPSEFSIVLEQIKGLQNLERLDIASEEFPCQHDIDIQLLHVRFPKLKIINGMQCLLQLTPSAQPLSSFFENEHTKCRCTSTSLRDPVGGKILFTWDVIRPEYTQRIRQPGTRFECTRIEYMLVHDF